MSEKSRIRRITAIALIACILISLGRSVAADAVSYIQGTITAQELYMRSGPSTDYDKLTVGDKAVLLVNGQSVKIYGEKDGWLHIKAEFEGETVDGYSLGKYIAYEGDLSTIGQKKGVITAGRLNVRSGASTNDSVLKVDGTSVVLTTGTEVVIIGEKDDWYRIETVFNGEKVTGYCLGTYVEVIEEKEEESVKEDSKKEDSKKEDSKKEDTKKEDSKEEDSKQENSEKEDSKNEDKAESGSNNASENNTEYSGISMTEEELPEGYVLESKTYQADYNFTGTVQADLLNLRRAANTFGKISAVLTKGTRVEIIGMSTTTDIGDGKETKTRWYKVVVLVEGQPLYGYVMSDYVELDFDGNIPATTKKKTLYMYKTASLEGTKVKDADGKAVKLTKDTEVTILSEVYKEGMKFFKIQTKYNGKTVKGYVDAIQVLPNVNATEFTVSYGVMSEQQEETSVPSNIIPTNPGDGSASQSETTPQKSFEGANSFIKGATALSVKVEPKYSSTAVFDSNNNLVTLNEGDSVQIIDVTVDTNVIWVYIRFYSNNTEYYGYINSNYIEVTESIKLLSTEKEQASQEVDFETKLEQQGFPESYKVKLRELHALYPNWEFKAFHTGLDWNTVIDNEYQVGKNLLPNSKSIEWKSLDEFAYSWKNDTFTPYDGSTWVTASKEAVEYYMDPRNFLTYNTIFQFETLNYNPERQDEQGVVTILKNTIMGGQSFQYTDAAGNVKTISYSEAFIMAAEYAGVNPFHLASRVKQEVTIGTSSFSNSATGTVSGYEGLYNFYNIGASDSTIPGGAIANGLKFAGNGRGSATYKTNCLIPWDNRLKAILGGAYFIGVGYVHAGQNTIYLQKFNVSSQNTYDHQYMTNVEVASSEGVRLYNGYENPVEVPVEFSIPVYLNMPEEVCAQPEKAYNPNNWLKSLKLYDIAGEKLTFSPSFDASIDQEYSLFVSSDVDYIKIKATTVSTLAKVTSAKEVYPTYGYNRITVSVKAENGDVREYVINIIREAGDEQTTPVPTEGAEPTPTPEVTPVETPGENADGSNADGGNEGSSTPIYLPTMP